MTAQTDTLLNLSKTLETTEGNDRLKLLEQLAWAYRKIDNQQAEAYALEGMKLAQEVNDSTAFHTIHLTLSIITAYQGKMEEAIHLAQESITYFDAQQHDFSSAKGRYIQASIFAANGNIPTSDTLADHAIQTFTKLQDSTYLPQCFSIRGMNFFANRRYEQAYQAYRKGLSFTTPTNQEGKSILWMRMGDLEYEFTNYAAALDAYFKALNACTTALEEANILSKISWIYQTLEDWEQALEYEEKAFELCENLNLQDELAFRLHQLGNIHQNKYNYGEALLHYNQALELKQKTATIPVSIGNTFLGLGEVYQIIDQHEKAKISYKNAAEQYVTFVSEYSDAPDAHLYQRKIGYVYHQLAAIHYATEQEEEALQLALQSLQIAKERQSVNLQKEVNELIAKIYKSQGEIEKAYPYQTAYLTLKDSLLNLEELRAIATLERQKSFNEQKKSFLEEKQSLVPISSKNASNYWLIPLFLILAISAFYFFLLQRRKQAQVENTISNIEQDVGKFEHYLKELLQRLDQEKMLVEQETSPPKPEQNSIKSLPTFLLENLKTAEHWQAFEYYFHKVKPNFFKNLKQQYPNITSNELNLCALLKLNVQNKEMAQIMGISPDSVRKAQHRLSKKMNLTNQQSLRDFILLF